MYRDPKQAKFWQTQYADLNKSYARLGEDYRKLEESLHAVSRLMNNEQAQRLNDIALDRDLYKLFKQLCDKLDGVRSEAIAVFLHDTVIDTNALWAQFITPFPRVPRITNLYGMYVNGGSTLREELQNIIDASESNIARIKEKIWDKLLQNTLNMKQEFQNNLLRIQDGTGVEPHLQT